MIDPTQSAERVARQMRERRERLDAVYRNARGRAAELSHEATEAQETISAASESQRLRAMGIPGFFPTPPALARQWVTRAGVRAGMRVLEPSAGDGPIAQAIREAGAEPDCVEWNYSLQQILRKRGFAVLGDDILAYNPGPVYDAVVMNPPFERLQDLDHIRHCYSLLKPGGKLVSATSAGWTFRDDLKARDFRAWLDTVGGYSEELPARSFATSGTLVNARVVYIEKRGV